MNTDVRALFKNYRLSSKGVTGKTGSFFVWFVSESDAQRAIAVLNGSSVDKKNVKVELEDA